MKEKIKWLAAAAAPYVAWVAFVSWALVEIVEGVMA